MTHNKYLIMNFKIFKSEIYKYLIMKVKIYESEIINI